MKAKTLFYCTQCGNETPKWQGQCPACGAWNTIVEQPAAPKSKGRSAAPSPLLPARTPKKVSEMTIDQEIRFPTGLAELDRVLGGGAVQGSLVLIGGAPGIGKSTLMLQICHRLCEFAKVLYVSGEESERQLKLRADRLGVGEIDLYLLSETDLAEVTAAVEATQPQILIVDSIQTMYNGDQTSSPGSVSQVKECTMALMQLAKGEGLTIFVIGHVNKEGSIAGPKVLEHIVDAVLYFEGDRQMTYRILRAVKNRYGSTNEIGVFDMGDRGLKQVENPSQAMLSGRPKDVAGSCVTAVMEGTRPLLAEIQGLATTSGYGTPRRMSTGFDYNRMALILAVLEKRAGFYFSNLDSYVNVVGGLRLDEPAVDLAVAVSLISSLKDTPVREDTVVFGEIGLTGELRSVSHSDLRIAEAARLGFTRCVLPYHGVRNLKSGAVEGMELIGARTLREAYEACV